MLNYVTDAVTASYRTVFDTVLSRLDAETLHTSVTDSLARVQEYDTVLHGIEHVFRYEDERLEQTVLDQHIANPVGLAAGFDKNGRIVDSMAALGFGHVEVGGVTSRPQDGNDRPRLHRVEDSEALINHMGFNNDGADTVAANLEQQDVPVPLGVNLGEHHAQPYTKTATATMNQLEEYGDYFVANISCPNIDGEALQTADHLAPVLDALQDANTAGTPVLVKLSPDLNDTALHDVVDTALDYDIDGIIATNTSPRRDLLPDGNYPDGGVSGEPLRTSATETVSTVYEYVGDEMPLIGVGGVASAEDAYEKIQAGASLVQLYTGMIYEGPAVAKNINTGLVDLLEDDGYEHISEAVGTAH